MKVQPVIKNKKVGWFRPIYFFAPAAIPLVPFSVLAFRAFNRPSEHIYFICACLGLTVIVQLTTAVREYKNWMFLFILRNVYVDYAQALGEIKSFVESDAGLTPIGLSGQDSPTNGEVWK